MATRRAAVVINDENSVLRAQKQAGAVKEITAVTTRRAALGELVNRNDRTRLADTKKFGNNNGSLEKVSTTIDLKNVKPRVDTHWNKPLTRTNSVKLTSLGSTTSQAVPKLVKQKSLETATVNKVNLVKKSKSPERQTTLKRTDSALIRIRKISTTVTSTVHTARISSNKETEQKLVKSNKVTPPGYIAEPPSFESRFPSYSNGLINDFEYLNIDEGDENNFLLVSEYVNDIYSYLFAMERRFAIRKNHLDQQNEIIPRMRTVLMDWINEVHCQYRFVQETFHISVSIIDRYLQAVKSTSRKNLQLVGVAALFIASKFEELYPPEVRDFVYITDNTYSKDDILRMEKHILKKLKFELGAPTSIHFLRRFSKAAQSDSLTHVIAKYFIELGCIDYRLLEYLPSEIAAASLFVALGLFKAVMDKSGNTNFASLWTPILEYYSTYQLKHLKPIVNNLIDYVIASPTSKTNNVYKKYSVEKLNKVSVLVEKSELVLRQIRSLVI